MDFTWDDLSLIARKLRSLGTRAPPMLREREMWGITFLPLIDILIEMATALVHRSLTRHFMGEDAKPETRFPEINEGLNALIRLLCGKDYNASDISLGFTYMDRTREEPVPSSFIINGSCQTKAATKTFSEQGHTTVRAVSVYF